MVEGLNALFNPSSVAVIGASASSGKVGNEVMRNLMKGDRDVYPVNPNETDILGVRCYGSVGDIPGKVDLAIVALPSEHSVAAVRGCVAKGVPAVIVSASGFRENGDEGRKREEAIIRTVSGTSTRVLGPNTMGLFVPSNSLDTLFISCERSSRPKAGSVAIISQSGAVAVSFMERVEAAGIGLSACVCLGNKCDIDEIDILEHLAADDCTKAIALYLESFSDGRRFVEASRAVSVEKPVVLLKSGRTPAGHRAARSHTGAISMSSDLVVDGAIRQAFASRAPDEEALVDISQALSIVNHARGGRICIIASAGGYGVIASDLVESEACPSLQMAELSEKTIQSLRRVVPSFTSPQNPVDLTAGVTDNMYDEALGVLQSDPGIDLIMMSLELQPPNVTSELIDIAARRNASGTTPIVVSAFAKDQASLLKAISGRGMAVYPTIRRTLSSLNAVAERASRLRED